MGENIKLPNRTLDHTCCAHYLRSGLPGQPLARMDFRSGISPIPSKYISRIDRITSWAGAPSQAASLFILSRNSGGIRAFNCTNSWPFWDCMDKVWHFCLKIPL